MCMVLFYESSMLCNLVKAMRVARLSQYSDDGDEHYYYGASDKDFYTASEVSSDYISNDKISSDSDRYVSTDVSY
jgi:hypothetical protein